MDGLKEALTLNIEERLNLQIIETQLQDASKEQLKTHCLELAKLYMHNQKLIKHLILNQR